MIQFDHVTQRYPGGQEGLSQVSFNLAKEEMVFLTGHSGSGKTTLLKLIALLEKPSCGTIIVDGRNLDRISERHIPDMRRQIGLIFQTPQLLTDRSIFENVSLPLVIEGYRPSEMSRRVHAALAKVGLENKGGLTPEMLSCGEQQRVGIARAIVSKPPILLADEPTGNLDPELSAEIMRLFVQLNQVGITILIATHDVNLIGTLPYRKLTLKEGCLINEKGE
jgi:cell division transport system ATP-binding protein